MINNCYYKCTNSSDEVIEIKFMIWIERSRSRVCFHVNEDCIGSKYNESIDNN